MCEITTATATYLAITAAMAAASTGASMYAADQQDKSNANNIRRQADAEAQNFRDAAARNKSYSEAEDLRQKGFEQQSQAIQDEQARQSQSDVIKKREADEAERLKNEYSKTGDEAVQGIIPVAATGGESGETGVRVVNDQSAKSLSKVSDYLKTLAANRGNMEAFGNTAFNRGLEMNRANTNIGQISNIAGVSRGAYGVERGTSDSIAGFLNNTIQSQAANAARNLQFVGQDARTVGQLLSGAAQVAGAGASASHNASLKTSAAPTATNAIGEYQFSSNTVPKAQAWKV